jgi:hypothetical protein
MRREYSRRLIDGVYFGQVQDGWFMFIRLPLGYGLNIGPGFTGYYSLKAWHLARNDYRMQFSHRSLGRWLKPKGCN